VDRGQVKAMARMGRFPFLVGGLFLYLMGCLCAALAGFPLSLTRILLGYAILGPAHLSVHYSNDYFDAEGDRLGTPTGISGGTGVLVARPDLRPPAKAPALALIGISLAMAVLASLTVLRTPLVLLFAVLGNAIGWYYSAPPVRLSSRGLGEPATALAFGFLIPGMGYLAVSGGLGLPFLAFSAPLLLLGIAFILTVEVPDAEADARSGKRTFVVRRGTLSSLRVILAASLAASLFYLVATGLFSPGMPWGSLLFASLIPLTPALFVNLDRVRPEDPGILVVFARQEITCLILFGAFSTLFLLLAYFLA